MGEISQRHAEKWQPVQRETGDLRADGNSDNDILRIKAAHLKSGVLKFKKIWHGPSGSGERVRMARAAVESEWLKSRLAESKQTSESSQSGD